MSKNVGLCSIPEAAKFLAISRGKMYLMIKQGECPVRQFGKSIRIPWAWLNSLAEVECPKSTEPIEK